MGTEIEVGERGFVAVERWEREEGESGHGCERDEREMEERDGDEREIWRREMVRWGRPKLN